MCLICGLIIILNLIKFHKFIYTKSGLHQHIGIGTQTLAPSLCPQLPVD